MGFAGQAAQAQAAAGERLFVTKIPQVVTKDDLTNYFSRFGTTTDVYVPAVPGSATHKGIAFVSFADAASVELTMGHPSHEINGSPIVVDVAAPKGGSVAHAAPVAHHAAAAGAESGRLFVTKVAPQLSSEHLNEYFAQFGELTDVYMPQAPGAETHKGICFVQFADPTACQTVLASGPHEVHGYPIVVDVAAAKGAPAGGKAAVGAFGKGKSKGKGKASDYDAGYAAGIAAAAGQGGKAARPFQPVQPPRQFQPAGGAPVSTSGRLFVTKVSPEVTRSDLELYFQQFGELADVFVPNGKGIAFVSFADPSCAAGVLQSPQHEVKPGCVVVCDQATEKGGGKGGGGKGKAKGFSPY